MLRKKEDICKDILLSTQKIKDKRDQISFKIQKKRGLIKQSQEEKVKEIKENNEKYTKERKLAELRNRYKTIVVFDVDRVIEYRNDANQIGHQKKKSRAKASKGEPLPKDYNPRSQCSQFITQQINVDEL